jgi:hypothetical protein
MLRFLGVLVLIVVGVACLGLYLGWFRIGTDSTDSQTNINIVVDKDKIKASENKVLDTVRGIGHKGTEPTSQPSGEPK